MERGESIVLGVIIAVIVGVWLVTREDDTNPIDELGDELTMLTSSEETRLSQLEPETQAAARQLIANVAAKGVRLHVGQTLRTTAQEKAVIDAGKSAVKSHSWHEIGRAVDMYPDDGFGSPDYNPTDLAFYHMMTDEAAALGFRSLAFNDDGSKMLITNSKGKKIWDGGHLEYRAPYGTIAEAVAAEGPAYGIT